MCLVITGQGTPRKSHDVSLGRLLTKVSNVDVTEQMRLQVRRTCVTFFKSTDSFLVMDTHVVSLT
ncbi:hypothetical protein DPMN_107219 [Dreissena polymorpha]|uniref:Uncharacterized protein n=1 Tax=Dreissena polymorpha TaxID=45954 RepID=A0A9D4K6C1_DREPO|nr:hypothetical protein DPMN_107219 [Dreissena polymorpha]